MIKQEIMWRLRRSMLELDILFERFVSQHYDHLSEAEKAFFIKLLSYEDHQILMLRHQTLPPLERKVVQKIFG